VQEGRSAPMSDHTTATAPSSADNQRGLRTVALVAVVIGVLALAAAAFLLSYSGIHAIALAAGVSAPLARIYPMVLDAMLVIACAAVLSLRGAGVLARLYAWLSLLVLLAAAAGADALHATNTKLPHRPAAAAVAIIPWVLVLIGFGLLLSMLRHARQRRLTAQQGTARRETAGPHEQRLGIHDLLRPQAQAQPPERETDAGQDDPTSDEAHAPDHPSANWVPGAGDERMADSVVADSAGYPAAGLSPAPVLSAPDETDEAAAGQHADNAPAAEPDSSALPQFRRLWSSPTPPAD
jgi:Protein of unknown function (DUF2637)